MTKIRSISEKVNLQKVFFETGKTKDVLYRKQLLSKLLAEIEKNETKIYTALTKDFKKPEFETFLTEIFFVKRELKSAIKNIKKWAKPKKVRSYLLNFPSSEYIYHQPYGAVLVIAPFNYPFQLSMLPLIGAIAAGNTVVLKPSEHTPNTSEVLKKIISNVFNSDCVEVIEGGVDVSQELLRQKWGYIFFTGSVSVGKIVAKAAAENLTPITLELGGKNPCIIDETAKIKLAAKRIAYGKFLNAGQTCIAPDYLLVHKSIFELFLKYLEFEITAFYSSQPESSTDFARIINKNHFDRLLALVKNENVLLGGEFDEESLFMSPTLIVNPSLESEIMKEEIFGPILPVISYESEEELKKIIDTHPNPLSLYVFSENDAFSEKIIKNFSFGGGTINDTLVHFANPKLPFGGVGSSGMGQYGNKYSFETFSHKKAIVKRGTWIDIALKYPPYQSKFAMIKKVLKWF